MIERLLTIYGVLLCTLQAIVSTLKQYYARWQYERVVNRVMRDHARQRHAIGKDLLPALLKFDESIKEQIEKGA